MFPRPFRNRNKLPYYFLGGNALDEFFHNFERNFLGDGLGHFGNTDIYEKDGILHYELELPGMEKSNINIQVKGDSLIISGEIDEKEESEGLNYLSKGRRYGWFVRSLPLPESVDNPNELEARFENGILHIQAKLTEQITEEETFDVEIE